VFKKKKGKPRDPFYALRGTAKKAEGSGKKVWGREGSLKRALVTVGGKWPE